MINASSDAHKIALSFADGNLIMTVDKTAFRLALAPSYLAATKDVTLNADTWTEGASVTLPTTYSKYNVQISVMHLNKNPMIERDLVGVQGAALNSFTTTKAGDVLQIGCSLVGQYDGGTKLYASHYMDGQNLSRAITSQIYVTYQPIN